MLESDVRKWIHANFTEFKNEILVDGDFLVRGLQERRVAMLISKAMPLSDLLERRIVAFGLDKQIDAESVYCTSSLIAVMTPLPPPPEG